MKKFICLFLSLIVIIFVSGCSGAPMMGDVKYDSYDEYLEEYKEIIENDYKDASVEPLSSFSLDSSTYAYSNLRRLIKNGSAINHDAVVIEQMLNYFNYSYINDTDNTLTSILELDICPWNSEHYLASIAVKAKEYKTADTRNNFVFLIDTSGSMNTDNKIGLFKQAFKLFMDNIDSNDLVSIVTYASGVRTIAEGIDGADKEELIKSIEQLEAYGSTNGSGGIQKAYHLAEKYFIENGNNRVLLATDGDFNVGLTSEGELERFISKKKESGVYLSVFGFGMGNTKHNKMETLASNGNGNAYYIDGLLEAKKVFVEELGGVLNTVANDTKIQIEFNPEAVKSYRLLGYENKLLTEEEFNNPNTDAGEIGAGHTTIAMYEIEPNENFRNSEYIFKSILRYKDSKTMNQIEEIKEIKKVGLVSRKDFIFASCVVEFGLLLRNSEYKGDANYNNIFNRMKEQNVLDDYYKEEFKELVSLMSDR